MDGVDGADVVAAGADQVGADAAVCRECAQRVPVAGDGLTPPELSVPWTGGAIGGT